MKAKGGYQILNLTADLEDSLDQGITIDGVYALISENSHQKPILLTGIVINGEKFNDVFVIPDMDDGDYVIEVYGYKLKIDDSDFVEVTEVVEKHLYKYAAYFNDADFGYAGQLEILSSTTLTLTEFKTDYDNYILKRTASEYVSNVATGQSFVNKVGIIVGVYIGTDNKLYAEILKPLLSDSSISFTSDHKEISPTTFTKLKLIQQIF